RDQTFVQFAGGVVPGQSQLRLERRDFNEPGNITPRSHRDGDVRDIDLENLHIFLFHTEPLDVADFSPKLQRHNQIDALSQPNALDAEHGGHVDDADTAHFHVIASDLSAGSHDLAAIEQRHLGHVVRDETVAALDQGQHALAFADAAFAFDDHAHPED